ncbi:sensor histidine kinase [Psychroserpens sp.]|uniref:sensor histidine kinase n=1 Tax=Psychroserpens sp. TaxID=2020870 RepID=UPI002B2753A6|nr:ATP-binding protein [Psychroserpens sp.]
MNDSKFRYILYIIIIVILSTIAIQAYWNYKNYLSHKQQLINEVQISLDKAVDDYYANLAERTTLGIFLEGDQRKDAFSEGSELDKLLKSIDESEQEFKNLDSLEISSIEGVTILKGFKADSMMEIQNELIHKSMSSDSFKIKAEHLKQKHDSIKFTDLKLLTSKVVISISNDSLNLKEVDRLLHIELERKNIALESQLKFYDSEMNIELSNRLDTVLIQDKDAQPDLILSTTSKSTFLPKGSVLQLNFSDNTSLVLKRILGGILISTLLVLAVISCLFYLLKIIKHQKQLSEVKNDLISNITHEFKTPIATIGVALESIKNFNAIDDKEKTKSYLDMSSTQLSKLNMMVEKLLETATLDSENLELNRDRYNISEIITTVVEKHKMQNDKTVHYDIDDNVFVNLDVFHFENAINNIIDNAFKYGGDQIEVQLKSKSAQVEIDISDNGTSISKGNKERVFEKFYRIPKGNTHDIKGFGIGLYYTKKIIEKHNGTIQILLDKHKTTFKIVLPYA